MNLTPTLLASLLLGFAASGAHALNLASSTTEHIGAVARSYAPRDTTLAGATPATRVLYGRVESSSGSLPGAVVKLIWQQADRRHQRGGRI